MQSCLPELWYFIQWSVAIMATHNDAINWALLSGGLFFLDY